MKSFEEWVKTFYFHVELLVNMCSAYNAGITEGIAEGRRLERDSMRCATCKFCEIGDDEFDPIKKCTCNDSDVGEIEYPKNFGCIFHELRKTNETNK